MSRDRKRKKKEKRAWPALNFVGAIYKPRRARNYTGSLTAAGLTAAGLTGANESTRRVFLFAAVALIMSGDGSAFHRSKHYAFLKSLVGHSLDRTQGYRQLLEFFNIPYADIHNGSDAVSTLHDRGVIAEDNVLALRNFFVGPRYDHAVQYAVHYYQARRLGLPESSDHLLEAAVRSLMTADQETAGATGKGWHPLAGVVPSESTDSATRPSFKATTPAESTGRCLVCEKGALQVALIPCGHYCLCKHCARGTFTKKCPVCSTRSNGYLRIRETAAVRPKASLPSSIAPPLPASFPSAPRDLSEEEERAAGRLPLR